MVVCDGSNLFGECLGFLHAIGGKSGGTHSHGSTVAKTVVWLGIIGEHPTPETTAIAAVGIFSADTLHTLHSFFRKVAVIGLAFKYRLRQGQRHDAVIRWETLISKEVKLLGTVVVPLKSGADNIPYDRS